MSDLSGLSDQELLALYQRPSAPDIMPALIAQESGGRAGVVGPQTPYGRAQGMTQMLPATAREMAGKIGVAWRPELMTARTPEAANYQQQLGQAYLQEGLDKTGSLEGGLKYYHGGPDQKLWGPKTEAYAKQVKARMGPDLSSMSDQELMALYQRGEIATPAPKQKPTAVSNRGPQRSGYQPINPPKPNGLVDSAMSFGQGLVDSAMGGADAMVKRALPLPAGVSAPSLLQGGLALGGKAAEALGAPKGTAAVAGQMVSGYAPKTEIGKVARTAGQIAPAALAPGSALARVANVVVPTATTELAGRGAEGLGAPQPIVDAARALGGIAGGVAANARIAPAPKAPKMSQAPDLDTLRTQKNAAYKAVDEAGVQYSPEATSRLSSTIKSAMDAEEIDPVLHPRALAVASRIDKLGEQPLTLTRLDKIRRTINDNVLASPSRDERRIGHIMRDTLDQFVTDTSPADVLSNGDPQVAAQSLTAARELNTRVAKIESVNAAVDRAKNRTQSTGSGGNIDNATRQEIRKVYERGRNWTPMEAQAFEGVVNGGSVQNFLRQFGKMSPSGNGLMQAGNLVAAAKTGGLSIPVSASAMAAKAVADGMTKSKVDNLVNLLASGKAAQAEALAKGDPQAAQLVTGLKRLNMNSSTLRGLSASKDPRWAQAGRFR